MNILEQSCKAPRECKTQRIMILCDRDGYANMQKFLFETLKDCPPYIDSITERMEEFFVCSDIGDYCISCEDYVFYNIVNIILCHQKSSSPLKDIPSVFYDVFLHEHLKKHVEQIRDICIIDHSVMEGCLDKNSYEIIDNIDWYDVAETTVRDHLFVGAEIVTNAIISSQIMSMLKNTLFCYDCNVNNAYVQPEDLVPETPDYKTWVQLITSVEKAKEKLGHSRYSITKTCSLGCAAKEITVVATLGEWYNFFKRIDASRMITSPDERKLVRLLADYFYEYAYIESFKTFLKELICTIDTQEELPF